MTLSGAETARYARHIVLKDIGGAGQQRIKAARVLVVGAGGLGGPVIASLAAAGVGVLGIADPDSVALSNLQRQFVYRTADTGMAKTEASERFVGALNPHVEVMRHPVALDRENAADVIAAYDLVVEGTDDFAAKQAIADACEAAKIPLVTGALGPFDGALTVLTPFETDPEGAPYPRFGDLYPHAPDPLDSPPCEIAGVLSVLPAIIGAMMANQALQLIARYGNPLVGKVLIYSARSGESHIMGYRRSEESLQP